MVHGIDCEQTDVEVDIYWLRDFYLDHLIQVYGIMSQT